MPGRVLLVSTSFGVGGGAEEQVATLAVGLRRRGWEVCIVSMLPPGHLPAVLAGSNIPIRSLGMKKGNADPRAVFAFAKIVREFKPDVLHSHMTHANLLARVARPLCDVRALISTLHGMKMYGVNKRFTFWRELGHRLTDRWADLTTTICEAAAQSYRDCSAVPDRKLRVIRNGVDTGRFAPNPAARTRVRQALGLEDQFVWIAAGRLEKPKAYDVMVEAFAVAARRAGSNSILLICGDGSLSGALSRQIESLGLESRIRLLGLRNDMPHLMAASDGYLMSSETEGLPMVLLQASACALPIVATDVGGNREIVQHERSGLLVSAGDANALASAISRIEVMDTSERSELGRAGCARVEQAFSSESVIDHWERVYWSLLKRGGLN